jgi:phosphoribosylanthranilate isomerase
LKIVNQKIENLKSKKVFESNPVKVKICGLTNLDDARFCSGMGADFLGFIFVETSKRYIKPEDAAEIIAWLEGPKKVGVFMNQGADDVNDTAHITKIDYIQLHGNESPEYCSLMEKPVIKTIPVGHFDDEEDLFEKAKAYRNVVDYLLFDTSVGGQTGGTGKIFNWALLKNFALDVPFFIAGGIGAENVAEAIKFAKPYAVDLSSSVEREPGIKDFDKIEAFFHALENIEHE